MGPFHQRQGIHTETQAKRTVSLRIVGAKFNYQPSIININIILSPLGLVSYFWLFKVVDGLQPVRSHQGSALRSWPLGKRLIVQVEDAGC